MSFDSRTIEIALNLEYWSYPMSSISVYWSYCKYLFHWGRILVERNLRRSLILCCLLLIRGIGCGIRLRVGGRRLCRRRFGYIWWLLRFIGEVSRRRPVFCLEYRLAVVYHQEWGSDYRTILVWCIVNWNYFIAFWRFS